MTAESPVVDNSKLRVSSEALIRMRNHEKPVYSYYDDGGRPGKGNCTWGIGILAHRGPCTAEELKRGVSPADVERAFAANVASSEKAVIKTVTRQALTQHQFDALVSFAFNVGVTRAQVTLQRVNRGDFKAAAQGISSSVYMRLQTKTGSKLVVARGLIRRRAEESAPFRI